MKKKSGPRFSVRPAYHSHELLIEFWGEPHSPDYPRLQKVLAEALNAHRCDDLSESSFDTWTYAWKYANGSYLIDIDTWSVFILAPQNNAQVISEIVQALVASGVFIQIEVDFKQYR